MKSHATRTIALAVALCATAITPILATPASAQNPFGIEDTRVARVEEACRLFVYNEIIEIRYNAAGQELSYRRTGRRCGTPARQEVRTFYVPSLEQALRMNRTQDITAADNGQCVRVDREGNIHRGYTGIRCEVAK